MTIPTVGIELDRDSIDYGDIGPGESSDEETVGITNTGTQDIDVTLEVDWCQCHSSKLLRAVALHRRHSIQPNYGDCSDTGYTVGRCGHAVEGTIRLDWSRHSGSDLHLLSRGFLVPCLVGGGAVRSHHPL